MPSPQGNRLFRIRIWSYATNSGLGLSWSAWCPKYALTMHRATEGRATSRLSFFHSLYPPPKMRRRTRFSSSYIISSGPLFNPTKCHFSANHLLCSPADGPWPELRMAVAVKLRRRAYDMSWAIFHNQSRLINSVFDRLWRCRGVRELLLLVHPWPCHIMPHSLA